LYEEQGYICAYCERRIPVYDEERNCDHVVEHILPKSEHPELVLAYGNLAMCCPGRVGENAKYTRRNRHAHCDAKKDNRVLRFSLDDPSFYASLSFTSTGEVRSSNEVWDDDLNRVLNLNHSLLCQHRRRAWLGVVAQLYAIKRENGSMDMRSSIERLLASWESRHCEEIGGEEVLAYRAFCSMVVYMLRGLLGD
ncbi:MAG: hypothetical protein CSA97_04250, partial [Bacteroidetes bacterium]